VLPTTIPVYPSHSMTVPSLQHRDVANRCSMELPPTQLRPIVSTIYATSWSTITSCAASQPACALPTHVVKSSSIPVSTAPCQVSTYTTPLPPPPRNWTSELQILKCSPTASHVDWNSAAYSKMAPTSEIWPSAACSITTSTPQIWPSAACSKMTSIPQIWNSVAPPMVSSPSASIQTWFRAPSSPNVTKVSVPHYSISSSAITGTTRVMTTRTTILTNTEYRTQSFVPANYSLSNCTMSTKYSFSYKPNTAAALSAQAYTSARVQAEEEEQITKTAHLNNVSTQLSAISSEETATVTVAPQGSALSSYQISSSKFFETLVSVSFHV